MTQHEAAKTLAKQLQQEGYEVIGASSHPFGYLMSFQHKELKLQQCISVSHEGAKLLHATFVEFNQGELQ